MQLIAPFSTGTYYRVGALIYKHKETVSTLLESLTDDAIAQLYVTKLSTISLYLTKLARSHKERH